MSASSTTRWPAINLVKLIYSGDYTYKDWNAWLYKCEHGDNWTSLKSVYYGIQKGMQVAALDKMNTPHLVSNFIRMQMSIEKTMRRMWRKKHLGNVANLIGSPQIREFTEKKRQTDHDFEKWLKGVRY